MTSKWEAKRAGVFLSFEGGDGAGKSTHMKFLVKTLRELGLDVVCLREPGGTKVGEALREIVLDARNAELSPRAELLIYEAARAQIVDEAIVPALERGAVVVCDRFFDSTVAYQGFGRGLDRGFVDGANLFATDGLAPDRTIMMFAPSVAEGLTRATAVAEADRMELQGEAFHARVLEGFLSCAEADPARIRVVYTQEKRSDTFRSVCEQVADLLPELARAMEDPAFGVELDVEEGC